MSGNASRGIKGHSVVTFLYFIFICSDNFVLAYFSFWMLYIATQFFYFLQLCIHLYLFILLIALNIIA